MDIDHDLAALLNRTLTLDASIPPEIRASMEQELQAKVVAYSISQHYNHSAHTIVPAPIAPSPLRIPARPTCEVLLRQHGIDPATLLPPQLQLFRLAGTSQQNRLLALWSIFPPSQIPIEDPSVAWTPTTVELEEGRIKERLLQRHSKQVVREIEERQQQQHGHMTSLDGTAIQAPDGSWAPAIQDIQGDTEPYMVDGYMELMEEEFGYDTKLNSQAPFSPATDPVYQGAGWHEFASA